jgi:hypothetical protein
MPTNVPQLSPTWQDQLRAALKERERLATISTPSETEMEELPVKTGFEEKKVEEVSLKWRNVKLIFRDGKYHESYNADSFLLQIAKDDVEGAVEFIQRIIEITTPGKVFDRVAGDKK